uniref:PLCXc domain-containing protein n=1 Tax=Trichobilharzia regenti TaxID=157069 RepID=A0AA85KGB2_TRIRE|nr:unnamed protein product [Trichobilharzia regenti]
MECSCYHCEVFRQTMTYPSSWMSELPPHISQKPLNLISIPGSHDSFTYSITQSSRPSPEGPIYHLAKYIPRKLLSRILYPWSVTQSLSLSDQLKSGIRYFDFRVCSKRRRLKQCDSIDYEFYLVHGQYANLLSKELQSILDFLQSNPKEIVIVDCNHCYYFETDEQKDCFESLVLKTIGTSMFPYQPNIPSLNDMWNAKQQIIFISSHRKNHEIKHYKFWPSNCIESFWPETIDPLTMICFLNRHIGPHQYRPANSFYVHQGVLTPTVAFILRHPFSSVHHLAKIAGKYFEGWVTNPNRRAGVNGVNITLIDYVSTTYPSYVLDVISINYKTWPKC